MGFLHLRTYILSSCSTQGLLRGKAICSLPAIVFCPTDYFCSHSFLKALLNACHLPSTILVTRDTAVSVLIQPTILQRRNNRNYYQLFQVWLQQRFSCPGSFQPIQRDTFGAGAKRCFNLLTGEWRGGCRVHGRGPFMRILSSGRRRSSGGGWAGLCCSGCRSQSQAQGPGTGSLPPS